MFMVDYIIVQYLAIEQESDIKHLDISVNNAIT